MKIQRTDIYDKRIDMLDDHAPEHNIGLRIISKRAESMQYVSVFNLNNFVITIRA